MKGVGAALSDDVDQARGGELGGHAVRFDADLLDGFDGGDDIGGLRQDVHVDDAILQEGGAAYDLTGDDDLMTAAAEVGERATGGVGGFLETGAKRRDVEKSAAGGGERFERLAIADEGDFVTIFFDGHIGGVLGDFDGLGDVAEGEMKIGSDGLIDADGDLAAGFLKAVSFGGDAVLTGRERGNDVEAGRTGFDGAAAGRFDADDGDFAGRNAGAVGICDGAGDGAEVELGVRECR